MGVVHKLEPEIIDFIINKKNGESALSCRQISALVLDKFQIEVSKSSVNTIIKNAGMSMPVGRRRKQRRQKKILPANLLTPLARLPEPEIKSSPPSLPQTAPLTPTPVLFKAANCLLGGNFEEMPKELSWVRCIKATLPKGEHLYLDAQLHTIWSTPHTPYTFSAALSLIKKKLDSVFKGSAALTLFMAPGYDHPTKEFFNFILRLGQSQETLEFSFLGDKLEELESVIFEKPAKIPLLFGLWPWQFSQYRTTKKLSEFKPFYYEPIKENLFLADIDMDLINPSTKQTITLKGAALKKAPEEKINLVLLSNLPENTPAEEIAKTYLDSWPNREEAFRDYSRKIELFTYTLNTKEAFSLPSLGNTPETQDLFIRLQILPTGYEDKNFALAQERFYNLPAHLEHKNEFNLMLFSLPEGYAYLKDLQYACRRLNEKNIIFSNGKKIWFTTG